jgi:hypothetical protein
LKSLAANAPVRCPCIQRASSRRRMMAIEDLVAGLAGDPELPAHIAHALASKRRATKRRRSSITEHSLHGINTSRQTAKSVTHVSGTIFVTYVSGRTDQWLSWKPGAPG